MAKSGAKGRTMPPEVKAAYTQVESGIRSLGKSIEEIQRTLRQAERRIEADARARIRLLRKEARAQLATLLSMRPAVTKTLRSLGSAAEGSWQDVKQSADVMLAEGRSMAASVIERFRNALVG